MKLEPPTPPSSAGSKESFYDVKTAMGALNVSPRKGTSVRKHPTDGGVKFVPGHTKSRSLGTKYGQFKLHFDCVYSAGFKKHYLCTCELTKNGWNIVQKKG